MEIQRKERLLPTGEPEGLRERDGVRNDHASRCKTAQVLVPLLPPSANLEKASSLCFKMDRLP